ncbi:MAG: hypothetical protein WAV23_02335 [Minisyncoccia bacterium]
MKNTGNKKTTENITKKKRTKKESGVISLFFDLNEFSEKEIAEILLKINKLYQSIGGDEIIFKKQTLLKSNKKLSQ